LWFMADKITITFDSATTYVIDTTAIYELLPGFIAALIAAVIVACGLGVIGSVGEAKKLIPVIKTYQPQLSNKPVYDKQYEVFKNLYKSNKANFAALNG